MKAYRCDRCHKFFTSSKGSKYSIKVYKNGDTDLCNDCIKELEEWMEQYNADTANDAQNAQE